eukprot:7215074-Prymnesium_polylepis.1
MRAAAAAVAAARWVHASERAACGAPVVYRCSKISSGARYQRVTTCVVIWRVTLGRDERAEADDCAARRGEGRGVREGRRLRAPRRDSVRRAG